MLYLKMMQGSAAPGRSPRHEHSNVDCFRVTQLTRSQYLSGYEIKQLSHLFKVKPATKDGLYRRVDQQLHAIDRRLHSVTFSPHPTQLMNTTLYRIFIRAGHQIPTAAHRPFRNIALATADLHTHNGPIGGSAALCVGIGSMGRPKIRL